MARRKRQPTYYTYECTLTGDTFKTTRKVEKTDDLISVKAYYELNQDKDDRPEVIKKRIEIEAKERAALESLMQENAEPTDEKTKSDEKTQDKESK